MTITQAVEMLRERRYLERAATAIRRQSSAPEWAAVLLAIADRLAWSTYAIKVTDPALIAHAAAVLDAEPDPRSAFSATDWHSAWQAH